MDWLADDRGLGRDLGDNNSKRHSDGCIFFLPAEEVCTKIKFFHVFRHKFHGVNDFWLLDSIRWIKLVNILGSKT